MYTYIPTYGGNSNLNSPRGWVGSVQNRPGGPQPPWVDAVMNEKYQLFNHSHIG